MSCPLASGAQILPLEPPPVEGPTGGCGGGQLEEERMMDCGEQVVRGESEYRGCPVDGLMGIPCPIS